jgi:hypothetical protein
MLEVSQENKHLVRSIGKIPVRERQRLLLVKAIQTKPSHICQHYVITRSQRARVHGKGNKQGSQMHQLAYLILNNILCSSSVWIADQCNLFDRHGFADLEFAESTTRHHS